MNHLPRISSSVLALLALLALTGCVGGAIPMVKRDRGPGGVQLAKNSFDPLSIKVGATTRAEVLTKLAVIDTGVDTPNFFWGRWATSKWGYMFAVGSYAGAVAGDAGRIWSIHNLLVTFDEHGVAQRVELMDEGLPLWREIIKQSKSMQPISTPIVVKFGDKSDDSSKDTITLSATSVEVVQYKGRDRILGYKARNPKFKTWTFTPDKIRRISHISPDDKRNHPGTSCHVLHLSEKTPIGQKIPFCADPLDLFAIFRYLQRYAPGDMEWQ